MPDTIALNPRPQFLYRDSSAPVSEDTTLTPSNQFSDAYFSIDLAKSYSNSPYAQKNEGRKESGHQGPNGTADLVQGTFQSSKVSNKVGPENKLNEAFLTRSDTLTRKELGPEKKRKPIETMGRSNIRNQSTKSDTQESSGSFFQMLCGCCNPGYERNI
ncbi:uncharacterized protein LOC112194835 [Rosa chinensis]|nr:uncharacterized protein LOC112194835 [Rosa chinensis]